MEQMLYRATSSGFVMRKPATSGAPPRFGRSRGPEKGIDVALSLRSLTVRVFQVPNVGAEQFFGIRVAVSHDLPVGGLSANLDYSFNRRLRTLAAIGLGLRLWPHLGQFAPACTV